MTLFITKMFLKLTGNFPKAQNVLLTNNETSSSELISFINRAIKCKFNTLFILSIGNDLPIKKINKLKFELDQIIKEMKEKNIIKEINDIISCIIFLIPNDSDYISFF